MTLAAVEVQSSLRSRLSPPSRRHAATRRGKKSLADLAYARLEDMIVTLKLAPGSIMTEGNLSRRIHIGRTPMREALQRLQTRRLVTMLPRRGVMVSEISIVDHFALLETRRALDRLIAVKAARRATPEQKQALRRTGRMMTTAAAAGDMREFMRLDAEFDRLLESASRSPFAVEASVPLHAHCRRFWYSYRHNGDIARAAHHHAVLMKAVTDGNETAAGSASDTLIDYLEEFARAVLDIPGDGRKDMA
jgi:DNA-binding GntR family transcriptional regulator